MKTFIIKTVIGLFAAYILFEVTIGSRLDYFQNNIQALKSERTRIDIKDKIKKELKKGIEKENYFTDEERFLISSFIKKIVKELDLENE